MCECLTYDDGSMFLCEVCNDIRMRDAVIVDRTIRARRDAFRWLQDGMTGAGIVVATLDLALGELAEPNPNPF